MNFKKIMYDFLRKTGKYDANDYWLDDCNAMGLEGDWPAPRTVQLNTLSIRFCLVFFNFNELSVTGMARHNHSSQKTLSRARTSE